MVRGAAEAAVTAMAMALLLESAIESRTVKVTLADAAAVPVPERMPELLKDRPRGRLAESTDHLYGGAPPEATKDALYGAPTVTVEIDFVRMLSALPLMPLPQPPRNRHEKMTNVPQFTMFSTATPNSSRFP